MLLLLRSPGNFLSRIINVDEEAGFFCFIDKIQRHKDKETIDNCQLFIRTQERKFFLCKIFYFQKKIRTLLKFLIMEDKTMDEFYNMFSVFCLKNGLANVWTFATNFAPKRIFSYKNRVYERLFCCKY